MHKATITSVTSNGTWKHQNGFEMYSYEVTLNPEEGEEFTATVNAKSDNPKWMGHVNGQPVWYVTKGEHKGIPRVGIDTRPPQDRGSYSKQDPDTVKRIENSWAIQTAIQCLGPIGQSELSDDEYLKRVHELAPRLKKLRDVLGQ